MPDAFMAQVRKIAVVGVIAVLLAILLAVISIRVA